MPTKYSTGTVPSSNEEQGSSAVAARVVAAQSKTVDDLCTNARVAFYHCPSLSRIYSGCSIRIVAVHLLHRLVEGPVEHARATIVYLLFPLPKAVLGHHEQRLKRPRAHG